MGESLGTLGDLGWYCARSALKAFRYDSPEAVSCHYLEQTAEGVPVHAAATLKFSGGRTATFTCSYRLAYGQWLDIASEEQTLRIEDFVIPHKVDMCSYTIYKGGVYDRALCFPREVVKTEEFRGQAQHTVLVERMSSIAASGRLEAFWPEVAKQTTLLLLALEQSARQDGRWVRFE